MATLILSVIGYDGICNFRFPYGTLVLIFFPLLSRIDLSSGCVMGFLFLFCSFIHLVMNIAVNEHRLNVKKKF